MNNIYIFNQNELKSFSNYGISAFKERMMPSFQQKIIYAIAIFALSLIAACFYFKISKRSNNNITQTSQIDKIDKKIVNIASENGAANPAKEPAKNTNKEVNNKSKTEQPIAVDPVKVKAKEPKVTLDKASKANSAIITQSQLLFNEKQQQSFLTLLNGKSQTQLTSIEAGLQTLATRQFEAFSGDKLNVYNSLSDQYLSFVNAEQFINSVATLNDLYPYRALLMRQVGEEWTKKPITFTPSLQKIKELRTNNSNEWQAFLKERSGTSNTLLTNPQAYNNWLKAEALVAARAEQRLPITVKWLEEMHGIYAKGMQNGGHPVGHCRTPGIQVWASETKRYYIDGKYVQSELTAFLAWLQNRLDEHDREQKNIEHFPSIIQTAAQAYQWLVSIHPFPDGNGRISQLVMDYILQRYGILPASLMSWIAPVYGDNKPNVDEEVAINLVWSGIEESYRILK